MISNGSGQIELIPFEKGIQSGADGVMTAHIMLPNIIGEDLPSTLSGEILTGLLRKELGHEKLIITDAMNMKAISSYWSSSEAAVMAFMAGADIILMPSSLGEAYNGVLEAVKNGQITEERLNESLQRILTVKFQRNIIGNRKSALDPEIVLGCREHQYIVEKIEQKAGYKINPSIEKFQRFFSLIPKLHSLLLLELEQHMCNHLIHPTKLREFFATVINRRVKKRIVFAPANIVPQQFRRNTFIVIVSSLINTDYFCFIILSESRVEYHADIFIAAF